MKPPRILARSRVLFLVDLILIVIAALGSFALRTDLGPLFNYYLPQAYWLIGVSLVVAPIVFHLFGLYRRLWVYASIHELKLVVVAVTTSSVIISLIIVLLRAVQKLPYFPRSTLPIEWLLLMILIGGARFSLRVLSESLSSAHDTSAGARRVLVVGAGDAGALVVREMQKNAQLRLQPICFLDDDPDKQKQQIHGVPVVGTLEDLPRTVVTRRIHEVIIAIPSAPGRVIRQVAETCRQRGIPFRTMPGIYELIGGKVNVSRLREVEITDLLRREPARIDDSKIGVNLSGRRVLVTGAGGSIGSELCRQIARWMPASLLLLGHGENSIFETLLEIEENFPSLPIIPIIADIRDLDRLNIIFDELRPQVVFHTAAHKHVPLMEVNVEEAITNNVIGTRNVVEAALNFGVERLVMISTDKAIRPSSVYGATKRLAELLVLDAANRSGLPYSVVRFGNVLGSRGSVVPLFKRQIAHGGPVTVTHPDMKRYFMTIPEAVHLVLQAFSMGQGGEVFVLNMGEQVRILDLAEDLIRLSGLEPYKDIDIVFTGIRPGEKLSEELWDRWARYEPTQHPDIVLLADEDVLTGDALHRIVNELVHLAREGDAASIIRVLDECIPQAAVRSQPPPDITSLL
ncbi:MAG: nucleoside-diphosphate sugar epimerase/dehydratase [Anaerolineales bacterium]|nr:nucleoside-diphosphate sugar epimerase/dehydratase [Anaerolineales bacterium]